MSQIGRHHSPKQMFVRAATFSMDFPFLFVIFFSFFLFFHFCFINQFNLVSPARLNCTSFPISSFFLIKKPVSNPQNTAHVLVNLNWNCSNFNQNLIIRRTNWILLFVNSDDQTKLLIHHYLPKVFWLLILLKNSALLFKNDYDQLTHKHTSTKSRRHSNLMGTRVISNWNAFRLTTISIYFAN